jgi:3-dehydroquinate dehydratase/shikimate dehydrogenase
LKGRFLFGVGSTDEMASLLCETVTGDSMAELVAARDAATAGDMVELRLDGVADLDVARALQGRPRPAIVTCRPVWEGGRFARGEEERREILQRALALGAEFVDVEWRAGFLEVIQSDPARVVVSAHDFRGVPADLDGQVRSMRATGAATIKVAIMPARLADTIPLAAIGRQGGAVVVAMGDAGVPSRLLATRYGSKWTYAGHAVAPGQIPAARMLDEFRYRQVGPATRIFGVVSTNAMHSFSPALHNAAFAAAGLDAVYVPLRAVDVADFLTFAAAFDVEGASVTIPFKGDALRAASQADERTRVVGAANTLRRIGPAKAGPHIIGPPEGGPHDNREGDPGADVGAFRRPDSPADVGAGFSRPAWEATNTDIDGFLAPLAAAIGQSVRGSRVAVLGAGGSARAVIVALTSQGAGVTVHARRQDQARETAAALGAAVGDWPVPAGSWDVLINCTPLGGASMRDVSPLPRGPFGGRLVYDLTYGAGESALLREARAAGCRTLDGLPMLVAQAEHQFEWWTGQKPAPGVMQQAARKRLGIES